jgi:Zn-dependent alcohol dehydrogenase
MVATGICHSDLVVASIPDGAAGFRYPKMLGHEGAGVVEEVGPAVTVAQVGDPVLLSYDYCHDCEIYTDDQQPYCLDWFKLNILGGDSIFESSQRQDIGDRFFGQSSFAGVSVVSETSVVNVKDFVGEDPEKLKLLAPLGYGLMTGSGEVINGAKIKPHHILVVTGIGAVGLGAIMAAKIVGCGEIIAVDRVAHRLQVAQEVGATKILDTTQTGEGSSLAEEL